MPIRRTLFIAFLGVSLISAILLAAMAFVKARAALREEIERNASTQAEAVSAQIDKMIFERVQNAAVWSHLDVMQDLQIRDVDKRVSHFLSDVHDGYRDIYLSLSCVAADQTIVASSDASLIGLRDVTQAPVSENRVPLSATDVALDFQKGATSPDVYLRVPIRSSFADETLGELRLRLDWSTIYDVLDQRSGGQQILAVVDKDGKLVAGSATMRERGLLLSNVLADWRKGGGVSERDGAPVSDSPVIVSAARSKGYAQIGSFGWTTLVMQPEDAAMAPVHRMAVIFALLVLLMIPVALIVATWVSRSIARPIVALTRFTRRYARDKIATAPPTAGSGEVRELADAFVQLIRDIDVSQQNLIRASKLAVVGEMSAIIAHEVRTPLGILRSSAQMLSREPTISADGRELIGFIESETDRLNRLVSAMLDVVRPRASVYAIADMHELIRNSTAMLTAQAQTRGVTLHLQLGARDASVECDVEQITQVLLNLLLNALQILRDGGRIDITTFDDDQYLVVEIADDGPGIDELERSRVFEAFFFKREGGIGLGLAIVQGIINSHHGQIEAAESRYGGALFRFRLPRRRDEHER